MSHWEATDPQIERVEALMLEKFRAEPFHNLYLLYGYTQTGLVNGGTCSDKALSFYQALKPLGVRAKLHSAFIGGAEIHRLVRVELAGQAWFADVGNGWPSIHLFPLDYEIEYECYGMRYRSALSGRSMTIYITRKGVERMQMEIPFDSKPEKEILVDIAARFDRGIVYPFSRGPRFSQVIGEQFLFLRDDRIEIYGPSTYQEVTVAQEGVVGELLMTHFGFDIRKLGAHR